MDIVEPHMYDVDDAVAKIDGYIISIAGAASCVGEKRMVRINEVGRTAASALLLDEAGEVVAAPVRTPGARSSSRGRKRPAAPREPARDAEKDDGEQPAESKPRRTRTRAKAVKEEPAADANGADEPLAQAGSPVEADAPEKPAKEPQEASGDDGGEDGLQSKPRRRGRRGGRRRSAAKAEAGPE